MFYFLWNAILVLCQRQIFNQSKETLTRLIPNNKLRQLLINNEPGNLSSSVLWILRDLSENELMSSLYNI
jgi:hypothetical protein